MFRILKLYISTYYKILNSILVVVVEIRAVTLALPILDVMEAALIIEVAAAFKTIVTLIVITTTTVFPLMALVINSRITTAMEATIFKMLIGIVKT